MFIIHCQSHTSLIQLSCIEGLVLVGGDAIGSGVDGGDGGVTGDANVIIVSISNITADPNHDQEDVPVGKSTSIIATQLFENTML